MKATAESAGAPAQSSVDSGSPQATPDYSTTNNQVQGVDEADIVKNDGQYLYVVHQGKVEIVKAYPASELGTVGKIALDSAYISEISEIFVKGDKLVVFGQEQRAYHPFESVIQNLIPRPYYYQPNSFLKVYDISDRSKPVLVKTISIQGSYVQSRMIGGKVYALFNEQAYPDYPIPLIAVDGVPEQVSASDVKYFDYPDYGYQYNIFVGLDLNDLSQKEMRNILLMGYSQQVFVSTENFYVTYASNQRMRLPWSIFQDNLYSELPDDVKAKIQAVDASDVAEWRKERLKIAAANDYLEQLDSSERTRLYNLLGKAYETYQAQFKYSESTVIQKISLADFSYSGQGEVPGTVLNQYSMDEYNSYFRIATTTNPQWFWPRRLFVEPVAVDSAESGAAGGAQIRAPEPLPQPTVQPSENHVFVLDQNMKTVGRLEGLAPGEKIYSARFMGDRAYVVTFKQIDPLFAIDLSNPSEPKVLGYLKIPGYSSYLHPYDETHLIGVGKSTDEIASGSERGFALPKGVKLSLFDVSDVSAPKEIAKYDIGDRGTDSIALNDPKAFLFDKGKDGLLVLPITLAKIDPAKYPNGVDRWAYGDFVFQGAYVFNVDLQNGFVLKGRVGHASPEDLMKQGYYWHNTDVKRSAFIANTLYTISDRFIKANDLGTLSEQGSVEFQQDQPRGYGGYPMPLVETSVAGGGVVSSGVAEPEVIVN